MDYNLDIDFSHYDIGKTYYRQNNKCIFDPIREILIIETPEEIVRQKFIRYLIEELKVPKNKIGVEVPMTYFKKGARGRADILVYGEDEEGYNVPIIIVECKAPGIPLVDEVWFQAYKYDNILGAGFIIITNGDYTYAAVWDEVDKEYHYIEELPKYEDFISDKSFKFIFDDSEGWKRPDFKELLSKKNIEEFLDFGWIGEDTSENLYPLIMNLAGFLHDPKIKCSPFKVNGLNIIEDGHRYTWFGNAAGGIWEGDYRYFIIEDETGNNQIVSISIFGKAKCFNDPKWGNSKGTTTLVVAIDDFDKRHNSLQLNIDKYTKIKGNNYLVWHDGTLTIGKKGSAKRKEVIEFVQKQDPSLVDSSGKIIIGTLDCSEEINWKQKSTKEFIKNLIKYALVRDEFRRMKSGG
ncbi:type I restriction enzyme HsdR N-terminal domain-containing protein [Clostridium sp.]|uniref:type I restriction enzyme HsdR N-terminal domain-containing protein n=1 Tax=Clostridium sp. TaxID=1506 RepID=UPI0039F64522